MKSRYNIEMALIIEAHITKSQTMRIPSSQLT